MKEIEEATSNLVRSKDLFLLAGGEYTLVTIIVTYLFIVKILLPKYMESRKPYELRGFIIAYNVSQIVQCFWVIYLYFDGGFQLSDLWNTVRPDYNIANENANKISWAAYITYLMKFTELLETVLFTLRKKYNQVSFLHVYHHSATFILAYLYARYVGGGPLNFGLVLNHFVHIIMYTYYLLALVGGKALQKKLFHFKRFITQFQMFQFVLFLLCAAFGIYKGSYDAISWRFFGIYLFHIFAIFYLFYDFYQRTYVEIPGKGKNSVKKSE